MIGGATLSKRANPEKLAGLYASAGLALLWEIELRTPRALGFPSFVDELSFIGDNALWSRSARLMFLWHGLQG